MSTGSGRVGRRALRFRDLGEDESPDLVYFSSVSENTRRFVERLGRDAVRIPLRPRAEGALRVSRPYVLVLPTYGGGQRSGAVPKQVVQFLNDPVNRSLIRGVITSGNTNFGEHYCIAGPIVSAKCRVPELYRFELLGTSRDVARVAEGLDEFWSRQRSATDAPAGAPAATTAGTSTETPPGRPAATPVNNPTTTPRKDTA